MIKVLSLDPAMRHCGYAVRYIHELQESGLWAPKGQTLQRCQDELCGGVLSLLHRNARCVRVALVEIPEDGAFRRTRNRKGEVKKDCIKELNELGRAVGVLTHTLRNFGGILVHEVLPSEWMHKKKYEYLDDAEKLLGRRVTDHESDAIGMLTEFYKGNIRNVPAEVYRAAGVMR